MLRDRLAIVKARPAETGGLAAAVVAIIVHYLHTTDPEIVTALIVIVGSVPAVVTWVVELVRRRNGATPPGAG